jgi:uncharacterized membrane protein
MMLIHFPSALLPMDFICAAIGYYTGNAGFATASFYALLGGTVIGWLAVMTGTMDLLLVMKENAAALNKALVHGGINTVVILGYSLVAYKAYLHYPEMKIDSMGMLVTKGILLAVLVVGNYLGANLILKHKIAVAK